MPRKNKFQKMICDQVVIRDANIVDIPQIIQNSKTTSRFRMSNYINGIDEEELEYWINDSKSIVLVAEIYTEVIGYAYGIKISPKWFYFDAFLVSSKYQNLGIGKKMYAYLRNRCKNDGIQLLQGLVKASIKSSLKYWLRLGYEKGSKCIWVEDWVDED